MSKELPYFKFVISEWQNGDIVDENYYTQGVFISLCAYYWSKDCNVTMDKVRRRFRGDTDIITELVDLNIIKEKDDNCIIEFLDEQRQSKEVQTIVNRMNGAKGGRPPKTEKKPNGLFFANRNKSETKAKENRNVTNIEERKVKERKVKESKEEHIVPAENFDWGALLNLINKTFSRDFKVINEDTKRKYKARLKDGWTKDDIRNSIISVRDDPFHKGSGYKHITPEYFSRDKTLQQHSTGKSNIQSNGTSKTTVFSTASDRLADAKSRIAASFSNEVEESDFTTHGEPDSSEHFDSFDDVTSG